MPANASKTKKTKKNMKNIWLPGISGTYGEVVLKALWPESGLPFAPIGLSGLSATATKHKLQLEDLIP